MPEIIAMRKLNRMSDKFVRNYITIKIKRYIRNNGKKYVSKNVKKYVRIIRRYIRKNIRKNIKKYRRKKYQKIVANQSGKLGIINYILEGKKNIYHFIWLNQGDIKFNVIFIKYHNENY